MHCISDKPISLREAFIFVAYVWVLIGGWIPKPSGNQLFIEATTQGELNETNIVENLWTYEPCMAGKLGIIGIWDLNWISPTKISAFLAYLADDMPKPSNLPSEWGNVEIHFHTLRSPFQHVLLGKGINKHGTFSNKNREWVNIQHRNGKNGNRGWNY